jgi:hypothetical protein
MIAGLALVVVAGCRAADPGAEATTSRGPSAGSGSIAAATASSSATTIGPSLATSLPPDASPPAVPPTASLAAEGGDPVAAQLGTYTYADGGSDSPWLAGAPISVGAGEPLAVTLDPAVTIERWRARYVAADAGDPAGATGLGAGTGQVAFGAPPPGAWTVEIAVTFADGVGTASYFWQLDVAR